MEPGQVGFLATCNCRQKDCVRESYNILNAYADELYGSEEPASAKKDGIDGDEDIADALDKAITKTNEQKKAFRFNAIDTGVANCIFIKTTIPDPIPLAFKIVKDIANTKVQKTRYLLRLVPVEAVCKANLKDILAAAEPLFEKHFKIAEGKTFSINYNRRHNNDIKRMEIIEKLADLVYLKNSKHSVNLTTPEFSVIVEIIKGLCCLSVVEEYIQLRKYNLIEIVNGNKNTASNEKDDVADQDNVPDEKENIDEVLEGKQESLDDYEESTGKCEV